MPCWYVSFFLPSLPMPTSFVAMPFTLPSSLNRTSLAAVAGKISTPSSSAYHAG